MQASTSTSHGDVSKAQEKVEEQHQTIGQLQQQLQTMTQQVRELQAQSSSAGQVSASQHQTALATLDGQHQTALNSLSTLGAQHAELQKQHEGLTRQSENHKAESVTATQSVNTLSAQVAELQKQHAEAVKGLSVTKTEQEGLSRQHAALQVHHLVLTTCCCSTCHCHTWYSTPKQAWKAHSSAQIHD